MTRLTFTPGNHTYWLLDPASGKKKRVPSVSALKKTLHAFDVERYFLGLAADAATDGWDQLTSLAPTARRAAVLAAAQQRAERPREFGTAVHHYCEQLWGGDPVPVPDEYAGHVQAVADWWTTNRVSLVVAEAMCWADADDLGAGPMAGRLDLIVDHPELGRGLLDLKTWTGTSSGTPRHAEWAFQLAGYAAMEWLVDDDGQDVPFPGVDWCGVLHVGPPGAVLHLLTPDDRAAATEQVACARALKHLPKPTMKEAV